MADLIFKGVVHAIKELMAKSREMGMQTFDQALYELYETGEVGYEDALRNADSISELKLNIKLNSKRARTDNQQPKRELTMHEEPKPEPEPEVSGSATFSRPLTAIAAAAAK